MDYKVSLTDEKAVVLFNTLKDLEGKATPIKFCVSKNVKALKEGVENFTEEQEKIFNEYVKKDDKDEPVVKQAVKEVIDEIKSKGGNPPKLPFSSYEFDKPEKDFEKAMKELSEREREYTLYKEDTKRKIKIKMVREGKEIYEEVSIMSILEEPTCPVSSAHLTILSDYVLDI